MRRTEGDLIHELHKKYSTRLLEYAFRLTGDRHFAEDVVQDTFMIAYTKQEILAAHTKPLSYLMQVLRNTIRREQALAYRHRELPLLEDFDYGEADDPFSGLEELFPRELTEEDRELLRLRFQEGLRQREIGELKGITEAAARKQFSRALERFKKFFQIN